MSLILFAIGAVAGAAIGWGVWSLLPDTWRPARIPVAIVAGLIVGLNVAQIRLQPTNHSIEQELFQNEDSRPLAEAWRQADPQAFAAFIERARRARSTGSFNEMISQVQTDLRAAVQERLPYLPEAQIVALERNSRDTLLLYADHNPSLCFATIHEQPVHPAELQASDIFRRSTELARQRVTIFASAFRANARGPIDVMSEEERRLALADVGARMRTTINPSDISLIGADASSIVGHEKRYCEVMAAYEDALASAPEAGRLYRTLVSRQRR